MTKLSVQVIKVGGSLFAFDQLPQRVNAWREKGAAGISIFIAGGGDLVQPLRTAHERFGLDEEASHWLAVRAMTVTSRLLAKLLDVELVEEIEIVEQLIHMNRSFACVLDVEQFLRRREPGAPGCRLPMNWSCTSDAIAARVAEVLSADELVLMKSLSFPAGVFLEQAPRLGLVDEHFPLATRAFPHVSWVNLLLPASEQRVQHAPVLSGSRIEREM